MRTVEGTYRSHYPIVVGVLWRVDHRRNVVFGDMACGPSSTGEYNAGVRIFLKKRFYLYLWVSTKLEA